MLKNTKIKIKKKWIKDYEYEINNEQIKQKKKRENNAT